MIIDDEVVEGDEADDEADDEVDQIHVPHEK
jgi:hypothetical protein